MEHGQLRRDPADGGRVMGLTGQRKRIKEGIIKILSEWLMMEYYGNYDEVANDILGLVPKPEKCIMHKMQSPTTHVVYYQCSKCGGAQFDAPSKYCPHCARRVIATEDMRLWQ